MSGIEAVEMEHILLTYEEYKNRNKPNYKADDCSQSEPLQIL